MKKNLSLSSFKKVLKEIGNYRFLLIVSFVFSIISVLFTLYIPVLFGEAIDLIVYKGTDFVVLKNILFKIMVLIIVVGVVTWFNNIINNKVAYNVVKNIRSKAISKLQVLPLSYVDTQSTGDIVQRMIGDVDQISDGLLLGLSQVFSGFVTIIVTLYFMFEKSLPISLVVIILTPISFLTAKFIASKSYILFKKQNTTRGIQTALIDETISNQKLVKAFAYEKRASKSFKDVNDELEKYSREATFFSSLTNPCTRAINSLIYAIVALVGSYLILKDNLTVGGLTVLLSYANQYMKPFNDISSVVTELSNAVVCADRVFALIEEEAEIKEKDCIMPKSNGDIEINNISFRYVKDRPLIENFSLSVKKGENVAIVGPTGCGKTTFINLLMRFYDVDKGEIKIDGTSIYDVTRHSLRENYGMVLQETWIKEASVRDNISFGRCDISDEEIIEAAKKAHAYEFIKRLPNGLDTIIDDDFLSSGQKQLLCISRVMLAIPPMLILDEATSSIDTRTELQIQNAFDELTKGRTSFIVAHRLSTIRNADVILVMKDGKIIEKGSHEELLRQNGFYTKLYNSQFVKTDD